MAQRNKITIEDLNPTDIFARNFRGAATKYRAAGKRTFGIWVPDEVAVPLKEDGWNIKVAEPKEEGDPVRYYLEIEVSYKNVPPKIVLVNRKYKKVLDEDTVYMCDSINIEKADVRISPYYWEMAGNTGIKAYLDTMFITLVDDPLEDKYENIPYSSTDLFMSGEDEG